MCVCVCVCVCQCHDLLLEIRYLARFELFKKHQKSLTKQQFSFGSLQFKMETNIDAIYLATMSCYSQEGKRLEGLEFQKNVISILKTPMIQYM